MLRHVVKKTALAAAEHYLVLFARLLHNIDGFCRHVQVVEHGTRCILSVARWRLVLRRLHVVKVGRSLNYGTALHRHRLLVNILLVLEIHLNRGAQQAALHTRHRQEVRFERCGDMRGKRWLPSWSSASLTCAGGLNSFGLEFRSSSSADNHRSV